MRLTKVSPTRCSKDRRLIPCPVELIQLSGTKSPKLPLTLLAYCRLQRRYHCRPTASTMFGRNEVKSTTSRGTISVWEGCRDHDTTWRLPSWSTNEVKGSICGRVVPPCSLLLGMGTTMMEGYGGLALWWLHEGLGVSEVEQSVSLYSFLLWSTV